MRTYHLLRTVREAEGKTQKQLAKASGISVSTIGKIERERGKDVSPEFRRPTRTKPQTVFKLAVATGRLAPGVYTIAQLARKQKLFSREEFYLTAKESLELLQKAPKGRPNAAPSSTRHLRAVA